MRQASRYWQGSQDHDPHRVKNIMPLWIVLMKKMADRWMMTSNRAPSGASQAGQSYGGLRHRNGRRSFFTLIQYQRNTHRENAMQAKCNDIFFLAGANVGL